MTTPLAEIVLVPLEEDTLPLDLINAKYAPTWVKEGNHTLKKSYEATIVMDGNTIKNMSQDKLVAYLYEENLTPEQQEARYNRRYVLTEKGIETK